jgi:hypothetical protein
MSLDFVNVSTPKILPIPMQRQTTVSVTNTHKEPKDAALTKRKEATHRRQNRTRPNACPLQALVHAPIGSKPEPTEQRRQTCRLPLAQLLDGPVLLAHPHRAARQRRMERRHRANAPFVHSMRARCTAVGC